MLRMPIVAAIAVGVFAVPALADEVALPDEAVGVAVASISIISDAATPAGDTQITPEELALLRAAIADFGAETDVRVYLGPGIPKDVRNAALRQVWLRKPSILEYRGYEMD